jgi:hypothetical protein
MNKNKPNKNSAEEITNKKTFYNKLKRLNYINNLFIKKIIKNLL